MKIHCLIENTSIHPQLAAEHGLSLLIETGGHRILFDTGASAAFAENAAKMGLDLSSVDSAVISHGHYDHGGGIEHFLKINTHAPVWISPHAFAPHFNAEGNNIGLPQELRAHPRIRYTSDFLHQLLPGITLHGASGLVSPYPPENSRMTAMINNRLQPEDFRHEQYLLIEEAGRRVLISGCSHRGILNIACHFSPDYLIGGFHLMKTNPDSDAARLNQIADTLLTLPTQYYTGHCTGTSCFQALKNRMGNRLQAFATGQTIRI